MAQALDDLLKRWNSGEKNELHGSTNISHMAKWRCKNQKSDPFKNYKILRSGIPINFDVYTDEGRQKITEKHVYWLELEDGCIKACIKEWKNNLFKEISLHLCQAIWPNVHTRDIGLNERVVEGGMVIPIIPKNFFYYKKHNHKKSKTSPNKKKEKRRGDILPTKLKEMDLIKTHFNLEVYPPVTALYDSVLYYPLNIICSKAKKTKKNHPLEESAPSTIEPSIWNFFRQAQEKYEKRFTFPFKDIHSDEELIQHPQFDLLINTFNMFFPK